MKQEKLFQHKCLYRNSLMTIFCIQQTLGWQPCKLRVVLHEFLVILLQKMIIMELTQVLAAGHHKFQTIMKYGRIWR